MVVPIGENSIGIAVDVFNKRAGGHNGVAGAITSVSASFR
jgi:hypothetical protein